jgi:endonuclease/exonuclease/phosphatase family metal-dependent hydrolase
MRIMNKMVASAAVFAASLAVQAAGAFCDADSAAQELRIMSYNIYHGEGADKKLDLPRIASIIARQRPNYVGLQEVDSVTLRSKGVDQAGELGRLLGMHAEFAQAIPFQGGGYGVALLSREKPVSVRRIALPGKEPRVLLLCEFADCWVGNMHLDLTSEARLESARAVRAIASKLTATKPLFIVGDWNDEFKSKPLSVMREYLTVLSKLNCRTYHGFKKHPADDEYCIDYIAVDRAHAPKFAVKEAYVVSEPTASDHNPIVVSVSPASAEGAAGLPIAIFSEDFEQGSRRWNLPSGQWKVVDGAGLDGSRALVLEYAEGEIPKWIERNEMVPVEPGEAYRIEAWVKDDGFKAKDRPVSVSFAVYDAKNNLIRGAGAGTVRISDNIVRKDGFRRVECTTRPLPMKAVKGRFYIWAKEGSHGRVAFDGFKIYPAAVNALESLGCSAYRGEAAEGEVGHARTLRLRSRSFRVCKSRVNREHRHLRVVEAVEAELLAVRRPPERPVP